MRIYINTSALHRPFDDLSQARIREEAEAMAMLISAIRAGRAELLSSEYLVFEVTRNPEPDQLSIVLAVLALARRQVRVSRTAALRAEQLEAHGLRGLDAIHIACAEVGRANLLVTTDDRMLRSVRRTRAVEVRVVSPFEALAAVEKELQ